MKKQLLTSSEDFEHFANIHFHGGKPNAFQTPDKYPTVIVHQQLAGTHDIYDFVYLTDFPKPKLTKSAPQN